MKLQEWNKDVWTTPGLLMTTASGDFYIIMDLIDFKNYCFSHRNKTQGRLIILMEEVLNDQALYDILFGKKNNVLDLELMETVTHIFISVLQEHLKPEYKIEHLKIIRLLEKKLKCRGRMRIKERVVYDRNKNSK